MINEKKILLSLVFCSFTSILENITLICIQFCVSLYLHSLHDGDFVLALLAQATVYKSVLIFTLISVQFLAVVSMYIFA